jgi:integrase
MPFGEVPAFVEAIRDTTTAGASALEFLILTASRAGEVIGAKWEEIDLQAATWRIPGQRMKGGRDHTVPLSPRAVVILEALPRIGAFVFMTADGKKRIGSSTMRKLVKKLAPAYQVHGFRSSFRDWCGDRTSFDRETIEHALAHKLPDKVEASYRRGTSLDKRRRLMESWSAYLARPVGEARTL